MLLVSSCDATVLQMLLLPAFLRISIIATTATARPAPVEPAVAIGETLISPTGADRVLSDVMRCFSGLQTPQV